MRTTVVATLVLGLILAASGLSEVRAEGVPNKAGQQTVLGWQDCGGQDLCPAKTAVKSFTADGVPGAAVDFSKIHVAGHWDYNADYGLIHIVSGTVNAWVRASLFNRKFCDVAHNLPDPGRSKTVKPFGMGSGEPCL
jgi:hypothetical protein